MPKAPGPPNLVALTHALAAARDVDESLGFFGPNPVYDGRPLGLELSEGRAAVRAILAGWAGGYEDYREEVQEVLDLGHGLVFAAIRSTGRLPESTAPPLEGSHGLVIMWSGDKVERITMFATVDEARAAADVLVRERG